MPDFIDVRSDTVSKPTKEMRQLMVDAPIGDDLFYDDPTVNELQEKAAKLYGKEAAIYVPSGTMANLLAIMHHCQYKGDSAVIGNLSHLNNWERGNMAAAASVMPITVKNHEDGTLDLKEMDYYLRKADPHHSVPKLVCLESSHNQCNGRVLSTGYIREAKNLADKYEMKMHLDGARSLNAATYLGITPA